MIDKDCAVHGGRDNSARCKLDEIMMALPENQGGKGRHKCPYCAYDIGFQHGLQHAADTLRDTLLRESQNTGYS